MKRCIIFIVLLFDSVARYLSACSFYPYGEDVRYHMLEPGIFGYHRFSSFYYSSSYFTPSGEADDANILFWKKRCKGKPANDQIATALYGNDRKIFDPRSRNEFVRSLYQKGDTSAIAYLKFAIACGPLNTFLSDPWERGSSNLAERRKLISKALRKARAIDDLELKKRYVFLAIRLSFYNEDGEAVRKIYEDYFEKKGNKTIVDYWAMYFHTMYSRQNAAYKSYQASLVFANAPDKRFAVHDEYNTDIPVSETLKYAKTNREKAAVYLLAGIRTHGRAIDHIKNLYSADPSAEGCAFLLLREINKLEDWIYTPFYSHFEPSISDDGHKTEFATLEKRISDDRIYASRLLEFVNTVNQATVSDPLLFKITKAYLDHITGNSASAVEQFEDIGKRLPSKGAVGRQVQMLKAIALTAAEPAGNATIRQEIQSIIKSESENKRFLFAIAKELEFKGNVTEAAFIFSKITGQVWRTRTLHTTRESDFYAHWFDYLDAVYNESDIERIIHQAKSASPKGSFEQWKVAELKEQLPRLHELVGTKHLRKNQLQEALAAYNKVNDRLWTSEDHRIFAYLDSNPFYTNFYNEHGKTAADTIRFDKETIVRNLLKYLRLADDKNKPKRDYYYFLVANCYLNMSYWGNSWAMKRYYWSGSPQPSKLEDDDDYYGCVMARKYYLKAKAASRDKKFAALCLRMAGRCEKYRLASAYILRDGYMPLGLWDTLFDENKYYAQLKKEYPGYYDDLISNCDSFNEYFSAH